MRLVKRVFVDTSVLLRCYYAFVTPIVSYCSPVWGQLLTVTFSFMSARCIQWPGFALIRVSCHCVIDVVLLDCVCCTRFILTRIIVCSVRCLLLLPEFGIVCSSSIRVWTVKVSNVPTCRCFLLAGPSSHMWNDLLYTLFDIGTVNGFKGAVNRWLLPWFFFSWLKCLWGFERNV